MKVRRFVSKENEFALRKNKFGLKGSQVRVVGLPNIVSDHKSIMRIAVKDDRHVQDGVLGSNALADRNVLSDTKNRRRYMYLYLEYV